MELKERINILIQAAELAQSGGALTLNDAVIVKQAIDTCQNGGDDLKNAVYTLIKISIQGQKKGIYTLRDAHFIFLATENIDTFFPKEN